MILKQQWEKRFDEKFISTVYPFLGGQRNYFKMNDNRGIEDRTFEMDEINEIKNFISSLLTQAVEEERERILKIINTLIVKENNVFMETPEGKLYQCGIKSDTEI